MVKSIQDYIHKNRLLFFASILFFGIRLLLLDHSYLLRGERDITLTGYFLAHTGRDMYGTLLPHEFFGLDMPTPLLSFYYSALWWLIIPFKSVFFARFPYVLASTSYIFLIYETVKTITKNKALGVITALVFAFSPGTYHLSRLALEINIAGPFLLGGILSFIKKKRLLGYVFFTLAFFSYNGFRPLIFPLLLFLELYPLISEKKKVRSIIMPTIISVIFFFVVTAFSVVAVDGKLTFSRQSDLVFLSSVDLTEMVNYRRNTAVGPEIFKKLLNNKITAIGYYMLDVFVKGQNVEFLFSKGDPAAIYASTVSGQFFYIMLLFYYAGFFYIAQKKDVRYFYFLGFIVIGLVPAVINIDYVSFTIRSILSIVGYAFIIACGMLFFYELLKRYNRNVQIAALLCVVIAVGFESMYFGYNYFYRRPVTMFEMFFQSEHDLAEYLLQKKEPYIIYDDSPRNILATYYFLKKDVPFAQVQKNFQKMDPYNFDGMTLRGCKKTGETFVFKGHTIIADSCTNEEEYGTLATDKAATFIPYKDYSFRKAYMIFDTIPRSSK